MRKWFCEFLGTFVLVFAGTGAIVVNDVSGGAITHVGVALTFGLVVMALIYAIGDASGAHLNPAITFGFVCSHRFSAREAFPYMLSQCGGAFLASFVLAALFNHPTLGATLPSGSLLQSFVFEFLLTAILMFVILNVSIEAKETGVMAGAAVGAVIGLEAMFAGPICGASMNPARSLAPAVVAGEWRGLWIYLLAPFLGSAVGVICFSLARGPQISTTTAAHTSAVSKEQP